MNDPYPLNLNIEIDRQRLTFYLRTKWLLWWVIPLVMFGLVLAIGPIGNAFEKGTPSMGNLVLHAMTCLGIGFGIGLLLGLTGYLVVSHRMAARYAHSLEISVDGPFLQVRQYLFGQTDRKLHFRSIVDYATNQDSFMKHFGIYALQMSTMAGGPASTITIPGVKDCLKVRDILSDIDRLRENQ